MLSKLTPEELDKLRRYLIKKLAKVDNEIMLRNESMFKNIFN